ncbi:hypothetical protein HDU97_001028 [Phlyctochytrium planicorne]|nr:hypothetical protein HDU97_001028 [Phlyctochytrium planicorne]
MTSTPLPIRHLFTSGEFADVDVFYGDRKHQLHRVVLASQSVYFRNAIATFKQKEFDFNNLNFSPEVLDVVMESFYKPLDAPKLTSLIIKGISFDDVIACADFIAYDGLIDNIQTTIEKVTKPAIYNLGFVVRFLLSFKKAFQDVKLKVPEWFRKGMWPLSGISVPIIEQTGSDEVIPNEDFFHILAVQGVRFGGYSEERKFSLIKKAHDDIQDMERKEKLRKALPTLVDLTKIPVDDVFAMTTSMEEVQTLVVGPFKELIAGAQKRKRDDEEEETSKRRSGP